MRPFLLVLLLAATMTGLSAQDTPSVEYLGTVPAAQLVGGVGFNVDPLQDWEFKAAAAAGATSVRFQCGWENIETQTPPPLNQNRSPRFALTDACAQGLASARRYGLRPTVLAAYGPPYHELLHFSVPSGAAAGSRTIKIELAWAPTGVTLRQVEPFYATVLGGDRSYLTKLHGYAGGLVTDVRVDDATHATLTLASALTNDLPVNRSVLYVVNEYLYPPPASFSVSDPSNLAFAAYAKFLATSIKSFGMTGEVEIWNEPPWQDDPWDQRYLYYDDMTGAPAGPDQARLANYAFAALLQNDDYAVAGVNYVWGGTHKTGATTVFDWMHTATGVHARQPATVLTTEAWHPYGNTPEDGLWREPCMKAAVVADASNPYPGFYQCNLFGLAGGNSSLAEWYSLRQKLYDPKWGIKREITETGIPALFADTGHRVRYILRQLLGYQAAGVTPVQFYRLYDTSSYDFSFVTAPAPAGTYTVLPQLHAVTSLLQDAKELSSASDTISLSYARPNVRLYDGGVPLTCVAVEGLRAGHSSNSLIFTMWQRSNGAGWATLPSPAPARVTMELPQGLSAVRVVNLADRSDVQFTVSGSDLTLWVSDDPIAIFLDPPSTPASSLPGAPRNVRIVP